MLQKHDTDDGRMVGCAHAPIATVMTSLTCEMYGILGTILLIFSIWKRYENDLQHHNSLQVTIYLDNKEAIEKAAEKNEKLNVSEFMKPEYDLECLIWDVQESMPIKVIHKWVKGHQNELKDGRTIFGPFTQDTQLNIEMDKLAVAGTNLTPVH